MAILPPTDLKLVQAPDFNQTEFLLNYSGPINSLISGVWVDNFATTILKYKGAIKNGNRFDLYKPYVNVGNIGCDLRISTDILNGKPLEEWTITKTNFEKMRNRIGAKTI